MESDLFPFMANTTMMHKDIFSYPMDNFTLGMSLTSLEKNSSNSNSTTSRFSFDGCSEEDNPSSVFCYPLSSSKMEEVSDDADINEESFTMSISDAEAVGVQTGISALPSGLQHSIHGMYTQYTQHTVRN